MNFEYLEVLNICQLNEYDKNLAWVFRKSYRLRVLKSIKISNLDPNLTIIAYYV